MKYKLYSLLEFLAYYGVIGALKHIVRFLSDLIVVLAVSALFMRFFIICGLGQTASLIVGMASGIAANLYIKFRYTLL